MHEYEKEFEIHESREMCTAFSHEKGTKRHLEHPTFHRHFGMYGDCGLTGGVYRI